MHRLIYRGFDYFTEKYMEQLKYTDENVGIILDAIKESSKMEDSLIFIVTDHGGGANPKEHGVDNIKDMGIFVIAYEEDIASGFEIIEKVSIMDIAPTILKILDIEIPSSMEGNKNVFNV